MSQRRTLSTPCGRSPPTTGVRRSELLGIRWSDLNLKTGTATIRQIVIDGPGGYGRERDQKSVASGRTVHLSARTVEVPQRHRLAQDEAREAAGLAWKDHDLVFPRGDGTWWNPPRSRCRSCGRSRPPVSREFVCMT